MSSCTEPSPCSGSRGHRGMGLGLTCSAGSGDGWASAAASATRAGVKARTDDSCPFACVEGVRGGRASLLARTGLVPVAESRSDCSNLCSWACEKQAHQHRAGKTQALESTRHLKGKHCLLLLFQRPLTAYQVLLAHRESLITTGALTRTRANRVV